MGSFAADLFNIGRLSLKKIDFLVSLIFLELLYIKMGLFDGAFLFWQ